MYRSLYAWPLNIFIYYSDYFYIRNKLKSNKLWDLDAKKIIDRFSEILESIDRKLNNNNYLIDNKLTEADILLYSYLKIILNFKEFNDLKLYIQQFKNIQNSYANLNNHNNQLIKENYLHIFNN